MTTNTGTTVNKHFKYFFNREKAVNILHCCVLMTLYSSICPMLVFFLYRTDVTFSVVSCIGCCNLVILLAWTVFAKLVYGSGLLIWNINVSSTS